MDNSVTRFALHSVPHLHDMQKKSLKEAQRLSDEAWSNQDLWEQNLEAAISILENELKTNPNSTETMTSLGALLSDSGKHQEALSVLREAESNGSEDSKLFYNIGAVLMNAGSHKAAKSYFENSATLQPNPDTIRAYFDPQAH